MSVVFSVLLRARRWQHPHEFPRVAGMIACSESFVRGLPFLELCEAVPLHVCDRVGCARSARFALQAMRVRARNPAQLQSPQRRAAVCASAAASGWACTRCMAWVPQSATCYLHQLANRAKTRASQPTTGASKALVCLKKCTEKSTPPLRSIIKEPISGLLFSERFPFPKLPGAPRVSGRLVSGGTLFRRDVGNRTAEPDGKRL
jgi:hypothetical protein